MLLTVPDASRRAALLVALESLVRGAGDLHPALQQIAPATFDTAFAAGGARLLAAAVFGAAGMPDPDVIMMGGSGEATAFRTQGKVVLRAGADLIARDAVASVIRAATAIWRQGRDMAPAVAEDDELATSVFLSLGAAEAVAALARGERDRAEALGFLVAAQAIARGDAVSTAKLASELGPPMDLLYEDALRLLAPRRAELGNRLRAGEQDATGAPAARLFGPEPIAIASLRQLDDLLAAEPCACGGRWRLAGRPAEPAGDGAQRLSVVCRVCLQWRDVLFRVDADRSPP